MCGKDTHKMRKITRWTKMDGIVSLQFRKKGHVMPFSSETASFLIPSIFQLFL